MARRDRARSAVDVTTRSAASRHQKRSRVMSEAPRGVRAPPERLEQLGFRLVPERRGRRTRRGRGARLRTPSPPRSAGAPRPA